MSRIKDFFSFKRFKKVPFERVLINLRKEIDMLCDDEINGIKIMNVEIENKEGYQPKEIIDFVYSDRKVYLNNKYSDVKNELSKTSFVKDIKTEFIGDIIGTIVIKLIKDELNYVIITLSYNKKNKFDMKSWGYFIIKDGLIGNMLKRVDYLSPDVWSHRSMTLDSNSLYVEIRIYLTKNNLIGNIF